VRDFAGATTLPSSSASMFYLMVMRIMNMFHYL